MSALILCPGIYLHRKYLEPRNIRDLTAKQSTFPWDLEMEGDVLSDLLWTLT